MKTVPLHSRIGGNCFGMDMDAEAEEGSCEDEGGGAHDPSQCRGASEKCRDDGNDCCANQASGEAAQCADGWVPSTQPQSYDACPNYTCLPESGDCRATPNNAACADGYVVQRITCDAPEPPECAGVTCFDVPAGYTTRSAGTFFPTATSVITSLAEQLDSGQNVNQAPEAAGFCSWARCSETYVASVALPFAGGSTALCLNQCPLFIVVAAAGMTHVQ